LEKLPKISDPRGNLTFIESENHISFKINCVKWYYDLFNQEELKICTNPNSQNFIIALTGSFNVLLEKKNEEISLKKSNFGHLISNVSEINLNNLSTNSVVLILSSEYFNIKNNNEEDRLYQISENYTSLMNKKSMNYQNTLNDFFSNTVRDCKKISLNTVVNKEFKKTITENLKSVPFEIKRVYYLYDIPGGEERGGHAHKDLYQYIIAASGSFDVTINDGIDEKTVNMNRSYESIIIKPGIWRELSNFSSGSICLVLASDYYKESDYIRSFKEFKNLKKNDSSC
tara:strand:+ start:4566 stop:5423 length:858 start_codon:yes stop_codon:yes gene_type:complete